MSEWEIIGTLAPIWKPTKKGEVLEGRVARVYEGNYGLAVDVETAKGRVSLPAHKNLAASFDSMKAGDEVRITYQGEGQTKKGMKFRQYTVQRRRSK